MTTPLRLSLLLCAALALPALAQRPPGGTPRSRPVSPLGPRPQLAQPPLQEVQPSQDTQAAPAAQEAPQPPVPSPQPQPQPPRPQPATPPGGQTAPARPGQTGGEKTVRPKPTCEEVRRNARFNTFLKDVAIADLVQTVSDATCKTFILPESVRGKITIIGPENGRSEVTADEFYRAFLAALDANGLAVYQSGKYLKLVDKRAAKQTPIPLAEPGEVPTSAEQMVTAIFKVRNVDMEPLRGVLQQLVSKDGDTIPYPPDTIIVNDLGSNIRRLQRIVAQLDERPTSDYMQVVQIQYASAQDVAATIQKVFEQKAGATKGRASTPTTRAAPAGGAPESSLSAEGAGPVTLSQVIPDERTNKLIIVASPAAFERIRDLIAQVDIPVSGEGRINVYYLENANSEDLASTLQGLTQGGGGAAGGNRARPARGGAPGGGAQPAGGGATSAELFSGEVKISADKATNSLVIVASQGDYKNMVRVIQKLDVPRRQVFVEAVIMEVNLNRNGEFGVNLHTGVPVNTPVGQAGAITGTKFGQGLPPSFSIANLANFSGFLAGLQGPAITAPVLEEMGIKIPQFGVVLHALQTSSDVNILSTPHILTSDNEEAEITVGQNVPFQAGFSPASLGGVPGLSGTPGVTSGLNAFQGLGSLFAPISRQNVELKLTVKPQINDSDYIRLALTMQTEEIASNDPVLGPTTSKRSVKNTVVARDQETVVLGGIMQDRTIESVSKVPVLGDIPILGYLFRQTSKQKVKTNLLLILTPYIIRDQGDFRRIFERKMKERQRFVEQFYGQIPDYEVEMDFSRKTGPLGKMTQTMDRESAKIENGGPGEPGSRIIKPGSSPGQVSPSGPGTEPAPEGSELHPAEGETPAPEGIDASGGFSPTELRPPPEQGRIQPGAGEETQE